MYLTEGIGAAATARPNPRPRSRPRLISTSRQIQRPEALRCAPLDTFLQVRAMARYRGPRVAHKEKCMHDTRRAFRSILALFHHLLSDVLAYWRWYCERVAGTAVPEIYQQFVQKIASSKVLQRLCSDQLHDLKWRHALREQLGAMWEQFRYPQRTIKKLSKHDGRILRVTLHSTCACCAPRTTQEPRPLVRPGRLASGARPRRTGGGRERLAGATHPAYAATPSGAYSGSDRLHAV